MSTGAPRTIYVISDLHLGGAYPTPEHPRGFRMCTRPLSLARFIRGLAARSGSDRPIELVINGDFVDFLAEEYDGSFRPFAKTADDACIVLERLLDPTQRPEEAEVFAALRTFVEDGHALTILVGNHDAELTIPRVRERLVERLGAGPGRLTFVDDVYWIANAHIEHGNRYDGFNAISAVSLAALRDGDCAAFRPPPGSRLVATVMNPLKKDYPFIDLLKPENEAAIPVLLALDPHQWKHLGLIAKLKYEADRREHRVDPGSPIDVSGTTTSAGDGPQELTAREALDRVLDEVVGRDDELRTALAPGATTGEPVGVGALGTTEKFHLAALLLGTKNRVRALRIVLEALERDLSFETSVEEDARFIRAAEAAPSGTSYFIVGHTHLAKDVEVAPGRRYLNSGTWTDLLPFPDEILRRGEGETDHSVEAKLAGFLEDMRQGELDKWLKPRPSFVRLDYDGARVVDAELEWLEVHDP